MPHSIAGRASEPGLTLALALALTLTETSNVYFDTLAGLTRVLLRRAYWPITVQQFCNIAMKC